MTLGSENPRRVAIISNEATPYRMHVLRRISHELAAEVELHSLFTHSLTENSMPWKIDAEPGIRAVFWPERRLTLGKFYERNSLPLYRQIVSYLVEHRIERVVLLGYADVTRLLLLRWGRRAGVPVVITADSNVMSEGRVTGLKRLIKRRLVGWSVDQCAGLMPMGACGRAFFRLYRADHRKPTFLFPYEPDYAALQRVTPQRVQAVRERFGWQADRRRLLVCGRLIAVKRTADAIDAFAAIAADHPGWDLVIAGDGPLRSELEARVPVGIRPRVTFTGFMQFEETAACFHACHVLVHPSAYEPWGLVINEAAACGLAIVATEVTGAAVELVAEGVNGHLVTVGDPQALAGVLSDIMSGDRAIDMGQESPAQLDRWRRIADPVAGLAAMARYDRW